MKKKECWHSRGKDKKNGKRVYWKKEHSKGKKDKEKKKKECTQWESSLAHTSISLCSDQLMPTLYVVSISGIQIVLFLLTSFPPTTSFFL
jgi:hypothetical protein